MTAMSSSMLQRCIGSDGKGDTSFVSFYGSLREAKLAT